MLDVSHDGEGRVIGTSQSNKPLRQLLNPVAVGHPHGQRITRRGESEQAGGRADQFDFGPPVFARRRGSHHTTQMMRQQLHPVADPQGRKPRSQHIVRQGGSAPRIDRFRTAAEDETLGAARQYFRGRRRPVKQLGVNPRLPYAPSYELGVLGTKVKNRHSIARWQTAFATLRCGRREDVGASRSAP